MTFGERLVELRKERGFTNRNDFANYIGMPSTTLRNYETNVREPGHIFLKQMADIFHVSIDYLLCMTDDKTPPIQQHAFSSEEYDHIKKYRDLDDHGKDMVNTVLEKEYTRFIAEQENRNIIPLKTKDTSHLEVNAARPRTDLESDEVTTEMRQHDENIMDDTNF